MSPKVGHEFFCCALRLIITGDGQQHLFRRLVQDGADWYMGFKQAQLGHHMHFALANRSRDLTDEISDMIANASSILAGAGVKKSGIGMLLRVLDPDDLIPAVMNANDAKKLYAITGHEYFLQFCSKSQKRTIFSEGLGL